MTTADRHGRTIRLADAGRRGIRVETWLPGGWIDRGHVLPHRTGGWYAIDPDHEAHGDETPWTDYIDAERALLDLQPGLDQERSP